MKFVRVTFQALKSYLKMQADCLDRFAKKPCTPALKLIAKTMNEITKEMEELEKILEGSIYATDEEELVLELVSKLELF